MASEPEYLLPGGVVGLGAMDFRAQGPELPQTLHVSSRIGGASRASAESFPRRNPANREDVVTVASRASDAQIAEALQIAIEQGSAEGWQLAAACDPLLARFAAALEHNRELLSRFVARETGQPRPEIIADLRASLDIVRWLRAHRSQRVVLHQADPVARERNAQRVAVGACVTMGASVDVISEFAAAVLAPLSAGNAVVLAPGIRAPGTCALLAHLVHRVGFPGASLQVVHGDDATVCALLQTAKREGVTRLDSLQASRTSINPAVIAADADLSRALPALGRLIFRASGQGRSAVHHVLVHARIASAIKDGLANYADSLVLGAPDDDATTLGPLSSEIELHSWVEERGVAIAEGAELVRDGRRVPELKGGDGRSRPGLFAAPRVVAHARPSPELVACPRVGPSVLISEFDTIAEAVLFVGRLTWSEAVPLFTRDAAIVARMRRVVSSATLLYNPAESDTALVRASAWARLLHLEDRATCWQIVDREGVSIPQPPASSDDATLGPLPVLGGAEP